MATITPRGLGHRNGGHRGRGRAGRGRQPERGGGGTVLDHRGPDAGAGSAGDRRARACAAVAGRRRSPPDGELTRPPGGDGTRGCVPSVAARRRPPSRTTYRRARPGAPSGRARDLAVARRTPHGAVLESASAGCQPGDTRVRRRRPDRWPAATRLSGRGRPQPRTPGVGSGVRPEVERARSTPGTPTASHSSSGRPPGCRSTGCTSPGPLGPPTSCGTLRSSCTRPANPHRASPLVVRKRRSRPVGPGADLPAAEWIARIAACRCNRCLRFCARRSGNRSGADRGSAGVHASECTGAEAWTAPAPYSRSAPPLRRLARRWPTARRPQRSGAGLDCRRRDCRGRPAHRGPGPADWPRGRARRRCAGRPSPPIAGGPRRPRRPDFPPKNRGAELD